MKRPPSPHVESSIFSSPGPSLRERISLSFHHSFIFLLQDFNGLKQPLELALLYDSVRNL